MSKPIPSAWKRPAEVFESPSFRTEQSSSPDVETSPVPVDNEDGMAYLRSMSYIHTSGRFSSYPYLDDSRRSSTLHGSTLVHNSLAPTDYASSDDASAKAGKLGPSGKKSPLRDSSSWEGHGISELASTVPMMKKMKYGRLRYVDGLRFFAAILTLTSTVIATTSQKWSLGSSILYPFNSHFGLVLFLTISGRTLGLPWLLSRGDAVRTSNAEAAKAKAAKAARAAPKPEKILDESSGKVTPPLAEKSATLSSPPSSPSEEINSPDFQLIGMAMLARPFRFLLPILFVTGIQYGICHATGLYPNNANFEALIGTRPSWCFPNASQWIITATNLFVAEDKPTQLQAETGTLFFLPWLFQNSYYLYGLTMIITILQRDTRVAFMAILAFLSWCTLSYISPAILGLLIAELDISGKVATVKRANKLFNWGLQALVAAVFLLFLLVPQVRDPVNSGLSVIQVLRPSNQNNANIYSVVRFTDVICSALLLLFIELNGISQRVLSLAPFSMMGQQLAAAMVAIHGMLLWSIMPKIFPMTAQSSATSGAAANLAGIWALTLIFTLCLSILFRILIEIPSEMLGRAMLIFFYGQDNMQRLSSVTPKHVEKARNSGYLLPLPSLGNPMAKLGLTKVPWTS